MTRSEFRAQVVRDPDAPKARRWLVRFHGHVYPFASHQRALEAAVDPRHLCRHACICPVLHREATR